MSNTRDLNETPLHKNNNIVNEICTKGICMEMCPSEEVILRVKEKMVHVLELTRSGHKLVKCYCRSAANSNMAVPQLLRPFRVLSDTVHYLLLEISNRSNIKMSVMYDFLDDRLRAVRQDMTIQRLPPEECVVLLEPMIRFYIYYGYRLCDHPISEFDPVLNKKYLLECMKWFLNCCDVLQNTDKVEDDVDTILTHFNSLDISKTRPELSCDRILVESLYILCNLDSIHPLYRYLCLPNYLKRVSALKLAYNIAIANMKCNFIKIFKLSRKLCPLTFSALCLHHPMIQRRALQAMSFAYNSQHLTVPVEVLKQWLAFNSYEEARSTCMHYGLKVVKEKHGVCFNKHTFKVDVEQHQLTKYYQAKILQLKLEDVLSYTV
ncbi:SAC3 domain-containing protein 1 isoform X1 [Pararge aegeria]|uniref:SAC3 domain-containing protein 1 isoform X1 n=1 Tax=Pararge aegeria TaxID=116150 RepID=UPI0019CF7073|nr:SAC3 domain-containing protein 1 isoform X1 [Pararge aegeria]